MKILVGYEKSKVADHALKIAMKHAKAFGAQLFIVTSMKGGGEVPREEFETAEKNLEQVESAVRKEGIACKTRLSFEGLSPGEDLVAIAKNKDVEEIVVGVKRRSKVGKMIFGSNARYVILNAHCPVLAVK